MTTIRPVAADPSAEPAASAAHGSAPASDVPVAPVPIAPEPLPANRSEDTLRLTRSTIMMVADDASLLALVRNELAAAGYGRFIATAGAEAVVPMLIEHQPDVLLLDLAPKLASDQAGGFDLLKSLRGDERWRDLPVIVLADRTDATTLRRALDLDATDFVGRPPDASELVLRLRNALGFEAYRDRLLKLDPLTGLANRTEFMRRVEAVLSGAPDAAVPARSLMLLNLDRFKQVNDSLGHQFGDALLRAVAQRLSAVIARHAGIDRRADDPGATPWLARINADRFMALLPGARGDAAHEACIADIVAALGTPHHLNRRELFVSASIGLATFPADGRSAEVLTRRAELAVAQAKRRGGHTVEYYSSEIETRAADRLTLENQLRYAIRRQELRLHYQPKVDCATLRMVGVEALIRWQHPERGLIPPLDFIPIAEATGLIVEIGAWALHEACRQGRAWLDESLPPLQIAVNLSAGQAARSDIVATVAKTLTQTGFPANLLTLELTESLLMDPGDGAVRLIGALKALGVSISLDDFGTGYSSLTYLRRFPIDEIKIDRSFVLGLPTERDSVAITGAIIALAGGLDLQVVAEGVESIAELTFLRQFPRCRFQGYLFSRPVPGEVLTGMLRAMSRATTADSASASLARSDTSL